MVSTLCTGVEVGSFSYAGTTMYYLSMEVADSQPRVITGMCKYTLDDIIKQLTELRDGQKPTD
jgi:hypothetical protein